MSSDPVIVEVVRAGFVESVHRARVVVVGPDATVQYEAGAVGRRMYPRSANKPMQVVGMLGLGLDVTGDLLALSGASHAGEAIHVDGVRRMLEAAGLDESALQNTPDMPMDAAAAAAWAAAGHGPSSLTQNCSGKHAAMLTTAVRAGLDIATYRDPQHPVQVACREAIGELSGEVPQDVAVDGCGAPLWSLTLAGMARAFGRLAAAADGPAKAVADAYQAHPEMVSGTRHRERELHAAIPGLVCKGGAEACQGIGLPDGTGIAIKIADGGARAIPAIAAAVLQRLGHEHPTLTEHRRMPVLGHGDRVGEIRLAELP
ncbi:asparaginase [Propionibacteriaceae bacterium Y2011]